MTSIKDENEFDVDYGCFFLDEVVKSKLLLMECSAPATLHHLREWSRKFVAHALKSISSITPLLSAEMEKGLEQNWATIMGYEELPGSLSQSTTALKACLVNIGVYLMFQTERRRRDLIFAVDLLLLTLDTTRACLQEGDHEESKRLLNLAAQWIRPRMNDDSIYDLDVPLSEKLHATFRHCCTSLLVSSAMGFYHSAQYDEMLNLLKNSRQEKQQLNPIQSDALGRICYNMGQSLVKKEDFPSAVHWLNFANSFGKQVMDSGHSTEESRHYTENSLTLLAACYLRMDGVNNWPHVLELLDYGDNRAANLELRLESLIVAGKDCRNIATYLSKYLAAMLKEGADQKPMKKAVYRIFSHFDEKRPTLIELINMIPWPGSDGTYEGKQETWPAGLQSIHWVLAQFAARCYFAQERLDELFNLLVETSQWMDFDPEDEPAIRELVALAEATAVGYLNDKKDLENCIHWYDVIVTFIPKGIDPAVVWNAVSCSLRMPPPIGFQRARQFFKLIPRDDWDPKHLPIRLEMALLKGEHEDLGGIISRIDASGSTMDWSKVQLALCRSSAIIIKDREKLPGMLTYLRTTGLVDECQAAVLKGALLQLILRIQVEVLQNESAAEKSRKDEILAGILATFQSAYALTSSLHAEMRTWFARSAWNLGYMAKSSSHFRHHLLKTSYQLFSLDSTWKNEAELAGMTAIKAGLEFGHNSLNKNTVPYVRILRSSLGLVREFYSSSSTEPRPFQRLLMVNVMEFHIQCELRNWQKVDELFQSYLVVEDPLTPHRDAAFFQSLAAVLLSSAVNAKTDDGVVTGAVQDGNNVSSSHESFLRSRVPWRQLSGLRILAAKCLMKALDLLPSSSIQITQFCCWIIGVLFDNPMMMDEPFRLSQRLLMDQLRGRLRSTDVPFSEIRWMFSRIWNAALLCPDRKYKRQIARWLLEESQKMTAHSARLTELFKHQFDQVLMDSTTRR